MVAYRRWQQPKANPLQPQSALSTTRWACPPAARSASQFPQGARSAKWLAVHCRSKTCRDLTCASIAATSRGEVSGVIRTSAKQGFGAQGRHGSLVSNRSRPSWDRLMVFGQGLCVGQTLCARHQVQLRQCRALVSLPMANGWAGVKPSPLRLFSLHVCALPPSSLSAFSRWLFSPRPLAGQAGVRRFLQPSDSPVEHFHTRSRLSG